MISGIHSIWLVGAGIPGEWMSQYRILHLVVLTFILLFLVTILYSQYFTYFSLRKVYAIGRFKAAIFLAIILFPGLTVNAYWIAKATENPPGKIDGKFIRAFHKAMNNNFNERTLSQMMTDHAALLTPGWTMTKLLRAPSPEFPLSEFKRDKIYREKVDKLLASTNESQRILGYLIVGSSGDSSKENILLERINSEKRERAGISAAMSLLNLKTSHTTALFDFLVKYETIGDAHMLPLFVELDKDSLQKTAYLRIDSEDKKARIIAANILAVTQPNPKTEMLLKQAVRDWDISTKGYAIYSLSQLQVGNLLELLRPLLDSSKTRSVAVDALANSPSVEDRNHLLQMVEKCDTIPRHLLNGFYQSKNIESVKYWLKLLSSRPIPTNYFFMVSKQPLLLSDNILPELQSALLQIKDGQIRSNLVAALQNRTDETSLQIMISFLSSDDQVLRKAAARSLKNNISPKIQDKAIGDLIQRELRTK